MESLTRRVEGVIAAKGGSTWDVTQAHMRVKTDEQISFGSIVYIITQFLYTNSPDPH